MMTEKTLDTNKTTAKLTIKDLTGLVKMGIVDSNTIAAFAGLWLAMHFTNTPFLENITTVIFLVVGVAAIIAGAGCWNNYFDRDIDGLMERTKDRPTITGRITPKTTLVAFIVLTILGEILLFMTTPLAGIFGLIGVFLYNVVYTMWAKRKLVSNTIIGSFSGAMPPLIGWFAITPTIQQPAIMLFLLMFCWQPAHFYAIAIRRKDDYAAAGIPMLPVVKGVERGRKSILLWVGFLTILPFFMFDFGIVYVILATVLNVIWIVLGLRGYKTAEPYKWATLMFIYSLNYLVILFVAMMIIAPFV